MVEDIERKSASNLNISCFNMIKNFDQVCNYFVYWSCLFTRRTSNSLAYDMAIWAQVRLLISLNFFDDQYVPYFDE